MPSYLFEVPPHLSHHRQSSTVQKHPLVDNLHPAILTKVIVLDCRPQSIDIYPTKHTKSKSHWMSINSLVSLYLDTLWFGPDSPALKEIIEHWD